MPCSKCNQDKPTPVVFDGKAFCLSCGLAVLEEAHEKELVIAQIKLELKAANDELEDVNQQLATVKADHQQALVQKAELDKKIESLTHSIESLDDAHNSVSNRIDKLTAQLTEATKE